MPQVSLLKENRTKQSLHWNNQILPLVTSERSRRNNGSLFNVQSRPIKDIVGFRQNSQRLNQLPHHKKSTGLLCGEKFQINEKMNDSREREADPHSLFQISQNRDLEEEARDQAEQRLRELSRGHVHVPPPAVLVTPSQKRTTGDPSKRRHVSTDRRKHRVSKNRNRKPVVIPDNVEIIVISSGSENEDSPVQLNATRQHERRRRIYHPENHTDTFWRCPVSTCRRNSPEFGFQKNSYVERHIRNRHADELVYPCISGCSIAFGNERAWERHHWEFHADEMVEIVE